MTAPRPASVVLSFVVDLVLVIAFVLIGRASHGEDLPGTLNTLWPFPVGLIVGWLGMRAWASPRRVVWTGIGIWVATVLLGMLLRVASGQGVEVSFVIVATIVVAIFLLGWRGIVALVVRLRRRSA
ncbi:DUF3054 domain-containing protein [Glaciihabitans sp. UYNi722]|uniref:DUF3054 domain-containing protein n=1 Tax=Glaciihabitans sp. UYNi722 TaxID=3156344 RepID=UPI0033987435